MCLNLLREVFYEWVILSLSLQGILLLPFHLHRLERLQHMWMLHLYFLRVQNHSSKLSDWNMSFLCLCRCFFKYICVAESKFFSNLLRYLAPKRLT